MNNDLTDQSDSELETWRSNRGVASSKCERPAKQRTTRSSIMSEGIPNYSRRAVIRVLGGTAVGASFAGCLGSPNENGEATRRPDETYVEDPPNYDGWFDDVDNHSGTVDRRGQNEVIVRVGAGRRGMAFDPPAVMISPDTTIVYEWTGDGGTHNVSAEDGEFESEYSGSSGHTYNYTFEDTGVFKYVCEPHQSAGMKGAIVVE